MSHITAPPDELPKDFPDIEVNEALLVEILAFIRVHPDAHNQGSWARAQRVNSHYCTTSFCVAGWACALGTNGRPVIDTDELEYVEPGDKVPAATWLLDGQIININHLASKLLGLPLPGDKTWWVYSREHETYTEAQAAKARAAINLFGGELSRKEIHTFAADLLGITPAQLEAKVAARAEEVKAATFTLPDAVIDTDVAAGRHG